MRVVNLPPAKPERGVGRARTGEGQSDRPVGRVTLVGAGPGDPGWLTLRAVEALGSSDVVLFDSLVADEVLAFARSQARRISVGKRGGRPSCKQDEINRLMIRLARAGHHVVRLKAGDPMIFGRAGEELESLAREQIPVTIIPGISAAQALACALGVSLTHRDVAQGLRFVTGHSRHGGLPAEIDWAGLADPAITTIIYMGATLAPILVSHLMAAGLAADAPVAVGVALGRADEETAYVGLAELADHLARLDPVHPVVLGVGRVFALAAAAAQPLLRPPVLPLGQSLTRDLGRPLPLFDDGHRLHLGPDAVADHEAELIEGPGRHPREQGHIALRA